MRGVEIKQDLVGHLGVLVFDLSVYFDAVGILIEFIGYLKLVLGAIADLAVGP